MLTKLRNAAIPIRKQVNYGPFKGVGPGGPFVWHCNRCYQGVGGCETEEHAKSLAEEHAKTHPGMGVVYYEG
jgi:hypothetical protein